MPERRTLESGALFFELLDVIEITGKGLSTLRRHLKSGELKCSSKPGHKVWISREELLLFIDKMRRRLV